MFIKLLFEVKLFTTPCRTKISNNIEDASEAAIHTNDPKGGVLMANLLAQLECDDDHSQSIACKAPTNEK